MIQDRVIREFYEEQERAKLPGYVSRYDEFDFDEPPRQPHFKPAAGRQTGGGLRGGESTGRISGEPHTRGPHRQTMGATSPGPRERTSNGPKPSADGGSKTGGFGAGIF
jgi:hypothetical protein